MGNKIMMYAIAALLFSAMTLGLWFSVKEIGILEEEVSTAKKTIESQYAKIAQNNAQAEKDRQADAAALHEYKRSTEAHRALLIEIQNQLEEARNANKKLDDCFNMHYPDNVMLP